MRKFSFLFVALIWVLSACSGATNQPASLPVSGTKEVAPAAVATTEQAVATTSPAVMTTQAGAGQSGVVDYVLVPGESSLTYEVGETFLQENNRFNLAVGKTQGLTGDIQVNFDQPQSTTLGTMTVDITGLQSDSGRRDRMVQERFLQTAQFPTVTFKPTKIEGLPAKIEQGVEYPLTVQGDLTIRDTTKPATFQVNVKLQDGTLSGQAVTTFLMSDFGFGPISLMGMLKTEDQVKATLDFTAQPK